MLSAFQANAFQNTGFQAQLYLVKGGGYEDKTQKKRYLVRKADRLLVFSNEAQALAAMQEQSNVVPVVSKKKSKKAALVAAPIVLPAPQPEEQVDLQNIADLATQYRAEQEYQFLLKAKEYEALLNLYKKFKQREEDEIIVLLLAA
jgi:hypothetical protein